MSGNEILYNMTNCDYFRNGEMVNCLYEFSKRVNLPENREDKSIRETDWVSHSFLRPIYQRILLKLPHLNVNLI